MATQSAPDAASLKSWDEAFSYPLPTVRKLSTRLRRDIDEHRTRLRSLVGASYRDLLETAERIIDMDKQIQSVEHGLGDIGRRCNSNILERADTNYTQLERRWAQKDGDDARLRNVAQLKILTATLSVVRRLVRTEGEPLQAAKLMILTRLLYKSLSESSQPPTVLERYRRSISSLRNKLLAYIDDKVAEENVSTDILTTALSAYALLTNTSVRDVLKHFLAVRLAHLEGLLIVPNAAATLKSLSSYSATFLSVQAVFHKRLAEKLSTISRVTLLSDKHIKATQELSLDVYGRWIPDDIRGFTPWVQQDNLTPQEGRQAMIDYSSEAQGVLFKGLQQCLDNLMTLEAVLEVRKQVLGATLHTNPTVKTHGFEERLESYREAFALRLCDLITQSISSDDFTIDAVSSTISTSIWDLAQDDFDLSVGGSHFRQSILRKRKGHDVSFDRVLEPYRAWRSDVEKAWHIIQTIKSTKWAEYFEQDLENAEDEDVAPYQDMLSGQDATRLQQVLYGAVKDAGKQMFKQVEDAAQNGEPQFFIRVLRELHEQHIMLSGVIALPDAQSHIQHQLGDILHERIADTIATHGLDKLQQAYEARHFIPLDIWDGLPKLPLQPLPCTYRYVTAIQQEMAKVGDDIWSPSAVRKLKLAVQSKLVGILQTDIIVKSASVVNEVSDTDVLKPEEGTDEGYAQGRDDAQEPSEDAAAPNSSEDKQEPSEDATASNLGEDKQEEPGKAEAQTRATPPADLSLDHTQRLFDALYLARIFDVPGPDSLQSAVDELKTRVDLPVKDIQRLEKNAAEYWKKTYLLFGLLARSGSSYSK